MVGLGSGFILNSQLVTSSDTLPEVGILVWKLWKLQYGCFTYQHRVKPARLFATCCVVFHAIKFALLTVLSNFDTVTCCHVTFMCKLSPSTLLSYDVLLLLLLLLLPIRLLLHG